MSIFSPPPPPTPPFSSNYVVDLVVASKQTFFEATATMSTQSG